MAQQIEEQLTCPLENSRITFRMLSYLVLVDPHHFKHLTVTATNKNGEQVILNEENTPDFDIALACRTSASIPMIFESVKAELPGQEEPVELVDGGLIDNVPITILEEKWGTQAYTETLVMVFEEEIQQGGQSVFDRANPTPPYVTKFKEHILENCLLGLITGLKLQDPTIAKERLLSHIKTEYAHLLSFPVDLDTVEFEKASADTKKYAKIGKDRVNNFLTNYATTQESLVDLAT